MTESSGDSQSIDCVHLHASRPTTGCSTLAAVQVASRKGFVRMCEVCVLDRSSGMLREAASKGALAPCRAGAEALPFESGAFAKIVAVDAFHHIQEQAAAAQEFLRVLAPGGTLVIEEPDIRRASVKLVALGEAVALMRSHFLKASALARFFATAEVRIRVVEEAPNFWVVVEKSLPGR